MAQRTDTETPGVIRFQFDAEGLADNGITVLSRGSLEGIESSLEHTFAVCKVETGPQAGTVLVTACGALEISGPEHGEVWSPIRILVPMEGDASHTRLLGSDATDSSILQLGLAEVLATDIENGVMLIAELTVPTGMLRSPAVIGQVYVQTSLTTTVTADEVDESATRATTGGIGPDIIVENIGDTKRWGREGNITAYSIRTRACNAGDDRVNWVSGSTNHPVVSQNLFRLRDGRFEQIGLGWVKHAFSAIPDTMQGCVPGTMCTDFDQLGRWLGAYCTDVYQADFNGTQTNLGPRFEINPVTGAFPWPFTTFNQTGNSIYKRIQVHDNDLDPDQNVGALYFVEGQYVSPDEYANSAQFNNASYAPVTVAEGPLPDNDECQTKGDYCLIGPPGDSTVVAEPAIFAWAANNAGVTIETIDVPNDGRLFLAYKTTDLGGGTWHYEYAIQNLYSERAVGAFSVPLSDDMVISNVGFHDIDEHSGSPIDSTDWSDAQSDCGIRWATTPYDTNVFANAIRWGTLYNFRFESDASPASGNVFLELFKPAGPGEPSTIVVPADVPDAGPSALTALESFPPNNAIDARQPTNLDGTDPQGWQSIRLMFDGCANQMLLSDVTVDQDGGTLPPPGIESWSLIDDNSVEFVFDRMIEVGAWTSIHHTPSSTTWRIGYLPADVNGDRTSAPADILAVIDSLNGITPLPIWSTDVDRSLEAGPPDILRVIDLLNGASAFEPFLDRQLPE